MKLHGYDKSGKYCLDEIIGDDSKEYRFIIRDCSLFSSLLLHGLMRDFKN